MMNPDNKTVFLVQLHAILSQVRNVVQSGGETSASNSNSKLAALKTAVDEWIKDVETARAACEETQGHQATTSSTNASPTTTREVDSPMDVSTPDSELVTDSSFPTGIVSWSGTILSRLPADNDIGDHTLVDLVHFIATLFVVEGQESTKLRTFGRSLIHLVQVRCTSALRESLHLVALLTYGKLDAGVGVSPSSRLAGRASQLLASPRSENAILHHHSGEVGGSPHSDPMAGGEDGALVRSPSSRSAAGSQLPQQGITMPTPTLPSPVAVTLPGSGGGTAAPLILSTVHLAKAIRTSSAALTACVELAVFQVDNTDKNSLRFPLQISVDTLKQMYKTMTRFTRALEKAEWSHMPRETRERLLHHRETFDDLIETRTTELKALWGSALTQALGRVGRSIAPVVAFLVSIATPTTSTSSSSTAAGAAPPTTSSTIAATATTGSSTTTSSAAAAAAAAAAMASGTPSGGVGVDATHALFAFSAPPPPPPLPRRVEPTASSGGVKYQVPPLHSTTTATTEEDRKGEGITTSGGDTSQAPPSPAATLLSTSEMAVMNAFTTVLLSQVGLNYTADFVAALSTQCGDDSEGSLVATRIVTDTLHSLGSMHPAYLECIVAHRWRYSVLDGILSRIVSLQPAVLGSGLEDLRLLTTVSVSATHLHRVCGEIGHIYSGCIFRLLESANCPLFAKRELMLHLLRTFLQHQTTPPPPPHGGEEERNTAAAATAGTAAAAASPLPHPPAALRMGGGRYDRVPVLLRLYHCYDLDRHAHSLNVVQQFIAVLSRIVRMTTPAEFLRDAEIQTELLLQLRKKEESRNAGTGGSGAAPVPGSTFMVTDAEALVVYQQSLPLMALHGLVVAMELLRTQAPPESLVDAAVFRPLPLCDERDDKQKEQYLADVFSKSPKKALKLICDITPEMTHPPGSEEFLEACEAIKLPKPASKAIEEKVETVAHFIWTVPSLDASAVADYITTPEVFALQVCDNLMRRLPLRGLDLVDALDELLFTFSLPKEGQRIERLLEYFCDAYFDANQGPDIDRSIFPFADKDACFLVTVATVMLNTNLHNPMASAKMSEEAFCGQLRGCNGPEDFPRSFTKDIFARIARSPFRCAVSPAVAQTAAENIAATTRGIDSLFISVDERKQIAFGLERQRVLMDVHQLLYTRKRALPEMPGQDALWWTRLTRDLFLSTWSSVSAVFGPAMYDGAQTPEVVLPKCIRGLQALLCVAAAFALSTETEAMLLSILNLCSYESVREVCRKAILSIAASPYSVFFSVRCWAQVFALIIAVRQEKKPLHMTVETVLSRIETFTRYATSNREARQAAPPLRYSCSSPPESPLAAGGKDMLLLPHGEETNDGNDEAQAGQGRRRMSSLDPSSTTAPVGGGFTGLATDGGPLRGSPTESRQGEVGVWFSADEGVRRILIAMVTLLQEIALGDTHTLSQALQLLERCLSFTRIEHKMSASNKESKDVVSVKNVLNESGFQHIVLPSLPQLMARHSENDAALQLFCEFISKTFATIWSSSLVGVPMATSPSPAPFLFPAEEKSFECFDFFRSIFDASVNVSAVQARLLQCVSELSVMALHQPPQQQQQQQQQQHGRENHGWSALYPCFSAWRRLLYPIARSFATPHGAVGAESISALAVMVLRKVVSACVASCQEALGDSHRARLLRSPLLLLANVCYVGAMCGAEGDTAHSCVSMLSSLCSTGITLHASLHQMACRPSSSPTGGGCSHRRCQEQQHCHQDLHGEEAGDQSDSPLSMPGFSRRPTPEPGATDQFSSGTTAPPAYEELVAAFVEQLDVEKMVLCGGPSAEVQEERKNEGTDAVGSFSSRREAAAEEEHCLKNEKPPSRRCGCLTRADRQHHNPHLHFFPTHLMERLCLLLRCEREPVRSEVVEQIQKLLPALAKHRGLHRQCAMLICHVVLGSTVLGTAPMSLVDPTLIAFWLLSMSDVPSRMRRCSRAAFRASLHSILRLLTTDMLSTCPVEDRASVAELIMEQCIVVLVSSTQPTASATRSLAAHFLAPCVEHCAMPACGPAHMREVLLRCVGFVLASLRPPSMRASDLSQDEHHGEVEAHGGKAEMDFSAPASSSSSLLCWDYWQDDSTIERKLVDGYVAEVDTALQRLHSITDPKKITGRLAYSAMCSPPVCKCAAKATSAGITSTSAAPAVIFWSTFDRLCMRLEQEKEQQPQQQASPAVAQFSSVSMQSSSSAAAAGAVHLDEGTGEPSLPKAAATLPPHQQFFAGQGNRTEYYAVLTGLLSGIPRALTQLERAMNAEKEDGEVRSDGGGSHPLTAVGSTCSAALKTLEMQPPVGSGLFVKEEESQQDEDNGEPHHHHHHHHQVEEAVHDGAVVSSSSGVQGFPAEKSSSSTKSPVSAGHQFLRTPPPPHASCSSGVYGCCGCGRGVEETGDVVPRVGWNLPQSLSADGLLVLIIEVMSFIFRSFWEVNHPNAPQPQHHSSAGGLAPGGSSTTATVTASSTNNSNNMNNTATTMNSTSSMSSVLPHTAVRGVFNTYLEVALLSKVYPLRHVRDVFRDMTTIMRVLQQATFASSSNAVTGGSSSNSGAGAGAGGANSSATNRSRNNMFGMSSPGASLLLGMDSMAHNNPHNNNSPVFQSSTSGIGNNFLLDFSDLQRLSTQEQQHVRNCNSGMYHELCAVLEFWMYRLSSFKVETTRDKEIASFSTDCDVCHALVQLLPADRDPLVTSVKVYLEWFIYQKKIEEASMR